jgi:chloride channel protein, CIC family
VTRSILQELLRTQQSHDSRQLAEIVQANPVVAYPDEPLRIGVYRMAETGLTRLPMVTRDGSGKFLGIVSLRDLLQARVETP